MKPATAAVPFAVFWSDILLLPTSPARFGLGSTRVVKSPKGQHCSGLQVDVGQIRYCAFANGPVQSSRSQFCRFPEIMLPPHSEADFACASDFGLLPTRPQALFEVELRLPPQCGVRFGAPAVLLPVWCAVGQMGWARGSWMHSVWPARSARSCVTVWGRGWHDFYVLPGYCLNDQT